MGFFDEVLILLALIFFLAMGESDRGVGLLYQRVPDVLFIAQNILDTANLPEGVFCLVGIPCAVISFAISSMLMPER